MTGLLEVAYYKQSMQATEELLFWHITYYAKKR